MAWISDSLSNWEMNRPLQKLGPQRASVYSTYGARSHKLIFALLIPDGNRRFTTRRRTSRGPRWRARESGETRPSVEGPAYDEFIAAFRAEEVAAMLSDDPATGLNVCVGGPATVQRAVLSLWEEVGVSELMKASGRITKE